MKFGTHLAVCTQLLLFTASWIRLAEAADHSPEEDLPSIGQPERQRHHVRHNRRVQRKHATAPQQQLKQQQQQQANHFNSNKQRHSGGTVKRTRSLLRAGDYAQNTGTDGGVLQLSLERKEDPSAFTDAIRISPFSQMARTPPNRIIRDPPQSSSISLSFCGDGIVDMDRGENCDDGNTIDGDGCSSTCCLEINDIGLFPGEMFLNDGVLPPNNGKIVMCPDTMCLSLQYVLAPGMDIIGIDIHKGIAGVGLQEATFLPEDIILPVVGDGMFSKGTFHECIPVTPELVEDIETFPMDYYLEIRTIDIPDGALRGELKQLYSNGE